ncbi:hypothetical protein L917_21712, partial [Phytophthora nicotianae]
MGYSAGESKPAKKSHKSKKERSKKEESKKEKSKSKKEKTPRERSPSLSSAKQCSQPAPKRYFRFDLIHRGQFTGHCRRLGSPRQGSRTQGRMHARIGLPMDRLRGV